MHSWKLEEMLQGQCQHPSEEVPHQPKWNERKWYKGTKWRNVVPEGTARLGSDLYHLALKYPIGLE